MNRALIWKEFREQGLIVAALVVLGGGILVAAGLIFPAPTAGGPGDIRLTSEPSKLAIVLLVLASGVVVGGTLFAGEREQGTFPYLELLPVPRWRVWLGKVLAGLILVLVATGLLFVVAVAVGLVGPPAQLPFWGLIAFALALAAFGAGALGSSFAKTSLAACGLGMLATQGIAAVLQVLSVIVVMVFGRIVEGAGASDEPADYARQTAFGTLFGLMVVPLALSAWIYTAPDRNRFARDLRAARGEPVDRVRRRLLPRLRFLPKLGIRASLWVVARQNLVLTIVLVAVALVSGLSLLQPALPVLFVWPISTLLLGSIVGVTGWSDEQNAGSFRFWAERRMPVGRLWLAKVAFGAALVALLVVALGAPSLIAGAIHSASGDPVPTAFRSQLFLDRDFPVAEYLWLWPVYGFAFGHLAGMLFRKAAVGSAVGIMTGGSIVALWLPSLFGGGVHWYQLWIPPLLALLTARALVWSWALDQLGERRALLRLAAGSASIALAMAGGIAYRVLEIPERDNSEADFAYRAAIPPFDTNDAGREIRRAGSLFAEARASHRGGEPERPLWEEGRSQREVRADGRTVSTFLAQLPDALELGWPADRPDADAWLDDLMANGWAEPLAAAAKLPLGTVEDPSELTLGSPLKHLDALYGCEVPLLVRGLQRQAQGRPEPFVEAAAASLSLARNLRNKSLAICNIIAVRIEERTHTAILRWLEKLGDRPDLLREILLVVRHHDAICPKPFADGNLPEQTLMRNSVNAPTQFVKQHLQREYPKGRRDGVGADGALDNELELVAFAWAVPWERERLRRLVGLGNNRSYTGAEADCFDGLPGLGGQGRDNNARLRYNREANAIETPALVGRTASTLLLALRLHRAEKGKLPATLDALVPEYLPAVPLDPHDGKPFRYRISAGETIQMELLPPPVPAKPETFGALLGAAACEIRREPFLYSFSAVEPPSLESVGALLGGVSHQVESDPLEYRFSTANPPVGDDFDALLGIVYRLVQVPAGRGILWSVGPDKIDDGGKRLYVESPSRQPGQAAPGDLIFIEPEPAETR